MKLALDLPAETAIGLRRMAADCGLSLEDVAVIALREFLTMGGWIETAEIDEESETEGNA